jgi:hypothetical protein
VFTVENLSGVLVVIAKANGSDRRSVKGAALQLAETSPEAAAPVMHISTPSLAKPPVLPATATPSAPPICSPLKDASSSMSGPVPVPLPSHRTPPLQSSDSICATIQALATAAPLQPDSMLAADGLFANDESAKLLAALPEQSDWVSGYASNTAPSINLPRFSLRERLTSN